MDYFKQQKKIKKSVHINENNHVRLTDGIPLIDFCLWGIVNIIIYAYSPYV